MVRRFLLLLIPALICSVYAISQNTILKLNGRTVPALRYELKGDWLYYVKTDDEKEKLRRLDKYDIFSVLKADGTEDVIYDPDTSLDGDPTEMEVRRYIMGEQHAMATYNKPFNRPVGAGVGLTSAFFTGFYAPIGIFTYTLIIGRFDTKDIPYSTMIEPEVFNTEEFRSGYKKYARNKKIKQSLVWGGIGFAVGFPAFFLIFHD